jgi:hypothetical protein
LGGTVTETLPDEFSYVPLSSSLDDDDSQVIINGREVQFVLIGEDVSFTYEVTASPTPGPYTFEEGQLNGVDGNAPVTGDDMVTVGATATRSLDRTTVAPRGLLTVTITAANYGLGGTVTETLPNGFRYVPLSSSLETDDSQVRVTETLPDEFSYVPLSSSLDDDDSQVIINGREVQFVLIGEDVSFTYEG